LAFAAGSLYRLRNLLVRTGAPAEFVLSAAVSFRCGSWSPAAPARTVGLFDIYFDSGELSADGGPADSRKRLIERLGGTVTQVLQALKLIEKKEVAASRTGSSA
jgi:hypothetical protein